MATREIVQYFIKIEGEPHKQLGKLNKGLEHLQVAGQGAIGIVAGITAGTIAFGYALNDLTADVLGSIQALERQGKMFDLNARTMGALRLAASATGQELEDILPEDLAERMFDAANGSAELADIFKNKLKINIQDTNGQLRDASSVLPEVIGGLADMSNQTEAAALASILLGDNGRRMFATFKDRGDFERFVEAADEFGITSGPRAAEQARAWADAMSELTVASDTLKAALVDALGDDVVTLIRALTKGVLLLSDAFGDLVELGTNLNKLNLGRQLTILGAGGAGVRLLWEGSQGVLDTWRELLGVWEESEGRLERLNELGAAREGSGPQFNLAADLQAGVNFLPTPDLSPLATGAGDFMGPTLDMLERSEKKQDEHRKAVKKATKKAETQRERQIKPTIDAAVSSELLTKISERAEQAAQDQALALQRELRAMRDADTAAAALGGGGVGGLVGGALSGAIGGPIGLIVGALTSALDTEQGLAGGALDFQSQVIGFLDAIPQTIETMLTGEFLAQLLAGAAELFIRGFVTLPFEIGAAVANGLADSFRELPQALAEALRELLADLVNPFTGPDGKFLGIGGAKAEGGSGFFSQIPFLESGTPRITRGGFAVLHDDEMVVPAPHARAARSGGFGGVSFGGVQIVAPDLRSFLEQMARQSGSLGLNLDSSAYGA